MSLFGDLVNTAKGDLYQAVEGQAQTLIGQAVQTSTAGGLGGLLTKLQQGGLGEQVASWLADGHNIPVSQDQLQAVLGNDHIQQMAASMGLPAEQLLRGLAEHLPAIADAMPKPA